jgi:N utilization substance protein A
MAALVSPGAPVSTLMEYGLPENIVGQLIAGGVSTIEKLGAMTPEELEELQGIGAPAVERIRDAVNGYYSQFETPGEPAPGESPAGDEMGAVEAGTVEPAPEAIEKAPEVVEGEPAAEPEESAANAPSGPTVHSEQPETAAEHGTVAQAEVAEEESESDTIEDLGSRPLS